MFGFYHFMHKLKTYGRFSLVIIFLAIVSFIFFHNSNEFKQEVKVYHEQVRNSDQVAMLYLEYCIGRVIDRKKCLFSQPFFKLKQRKKSNAQTEVVLNDMGQKFVQSEHYLSFYQKLLFETDEIRRLKAYPLFVAEKKNIQKNLSEIHKKYFKTSKLNKSFLAVLKTLISMENLLQLSWLMFILIVFGQVLEKIMGIKTYLLLLIPGSSLAIYAYLFSIQSAEQTVSGAHIIISFLLGLSLGFGKRVSFYVNSKVKISLRFIAVALWITQEVVLHLYSPAASPHLAHFFSLCFGVLFGVVYTYYFLLPFGFLSPKAWSYWQGVGDQNLEYLLSVGTHILNENPDNYTVKRDMLISILDSKVKGENVNKYWNTIELILADLVSIYSLQESKEDLILQMLELVPEDLPLHPYLKKMKPKKYFVLLSLARRNNRTLLFIKLLESFLIYHKGNLKIIDIDKLNVASLEFSEELQDITRKYVLNSSSVSLQDYIIPYLTK